MQPVAGARPTTHTIWSWRELNKRRPAIVEQAGSGLGWPAELCASRADDDHDDHATGHDDHHEGAANTDATHVHI